MKFRGSAHPKSEPMEYGGRVYVSRLEARYAAELDLRKRAGEVLEWAAQPAALACVVNGTLVCSWTPDFLVELANGTSVLVECKGRWSPLQRLKMRLVKACFPDVCIYVHGAPLDKRRKT